MAQTKEQAEALFQEAVDELKPLVEKIEKEAPTTKNHYGTYMAVLLQAKETQVRKLTALALIKAGANKSGVLAALKLVS